MLQSSFLRPFAAAALAAALGYVVITLAKLVVEDEITRQIVLIPGLLAVGLGSSALLGLKLFDRLGGGGSCGWGDGDGCD